MVDTGASLFDQVEAPDIRKQMGLVLLVVAHKLLFGYNTKIFLYLINLHT